MADVVSFLLLMGYAAAYSVAALAWIFAMGNLFRVVTFRRPGVPLWSAELVYFPFTLVFRPDLLTERGRQSRRWFGIAVVVFLGALVLGLALGTLK